MADNRAIVYVENGIPVYRASSLGLPLRCLTAARMGETPLEAPEYLRRAAEAGNRYEVIVKERLTADGYVIGEEQGSVEIKVPLNYAVEYAVIRGHLDATSIISPGDPQDRMLEVKSMSENVWAKWTAHRMDGFPSYAAQLTVYMTAVGKPALYAVVNRVTDEIELIPYDETPIEFEDLANKVRSVEALNTQGVLPPCTGAQYSCAYDYLCDRRDIDPADVPPDDDTALAVALDRYDEVREMAKTFDAMKATARDDVILALAGRKKAIVGTTSVSYVKSTRKSLSTKRLRDKLGHELDDFYDVKEFEQLRVSKAKEAKADGNDD